VRVRVRVRVRARARVRGRIRGRGRVGVRVGRTCSLASLRRARSAWASAVDALATRCWVCCAASSALALAEPFHSCG
jgi:hypothetical protein